MQHNAVVWVIIRLSKRWPIVVILFRILYNNKRPRSEGHAKFGATNTGRFSCPAWNLSRRGAPVWTGQDPARGQHQPLQGGCCTLGLVWEKKGFPCQYYFWRGQIIGLEWTWWRLFLWRFDVGTSFSLSVLVFFFSCALCFNKSSTVLPCLLEISIANNTASIVCECSFSCHHNYSKLHVFITFNIS